MKYEILYRTLGESRDKSAGNYGTRIVSAVNN